jgi:hypothetical protein
MSDTQLFKLGGGQNRGKTRPSIGSNTDQDRWMITKDVTTTDGREYGQLLISQLLLAIKIRNLHGH